MTRSTRLSWPLAALAVALAAPVAAQTFTDVSSQFPLAAGGSGLGIAIVDVDGNGQADAIVGATLFRQVDGLFEATAIAEPFGSLGALVADVDNDGRREIVLLAAFTPRLLRYRPAHADFVAPDATGIVWDEEDLLQGSVMLDYDRDGLLDVLLGNDNGGDRLYHNLGGGQFAEAGPSVFPHVGFGTYGMATADYDRDGDPDVFVGICTPGDSNRLFRNDGASGFTEVAGPAGVANPNGGAWGVTWLDYDNDGWMDLYVVNARLAVELDRLYRNRGDGTFADVTEAVGLAHTGGGSSSVVAADFDNDGWTDLFVTDNYGDTATLFRNGGDGTFADATAAAGLAGTLRAFPTAAGDLDGDGWLDLMVYEPVSGTEEPAPGSVWLNDGGTNGWLAVRLRGVASNRDGVGARVEVTAGGRTQVREISGGEGFMSHSFGLSAHVGLGAATAADVTVRWPSGHVDTLPGVAANQTVTLVEGVGRNEPPGRFALTAPADGAVVSPAGTLTWEAAPDAEGDAVTYTVLLSGAGGDQEIAAAGTSLALPTLPDGAYRWAVVARDAYGVRTSLDPQGFFVGVVAGEGTPEAGTLTLRVAPNPTAVGTTVVVGAPPGIAVRVAAYDVLGREVAVLHTAALEGDRLSLDVGVLAPGVYTVRASGGGAVAAARLTVTP